jgi:hypothetical protein
MKKSLKTGVQRRKQGHFAGHRSQVLLLAGRPPPPADIGVAMASISRSPSPRPTSSSGGGAAAAAGGQTLHPSSSLTLGVPRRAASAPPEPSPARAEPQRLRMRAPRISESTLRLFESSWFNIGMAISYLYRFRADEETQAVSCFPAHSTARTKQLTRMLALTHSHTHLHTRSRN